MLKRQQLADSVHCLTKFLHLDLVSLHEIITGEGALCYISNLLQQYELLLNPLPALTYQTVLDLNAACRSKRTETYWLFSS